ncbi:hypothetical protein SAMN05878443_2334 [Carnobacterium alterfunditum]|uniref:Uncharacterized protein n=1 Tax=Carnobacterium alterfunditum TaxID=28230 RepID=A0A1N6IHN9_9LACT|nr:hypothetical protein [Carnobacterium alterfunditum]SIO31544.1 hypothetical protein SAMN05878443_2334 [Carnobacterium alterfunditum]
MSILSLIKLIKTGVNMKIIELLKKENIKYKEVEYSREATIFNVNNKLNLVVIYGNNNNFMMERELFYYLNTHKLHYAICLVNKIEKRLFLLTFKIKHNWLLSSFSGTDKERLHLGKIVLNNPINEINLVNFLLTYN